MLRSEDPRYSRLLAEVSEEVKLPEWCRSNVSPIVNAPVERWPRCCDSGCEPCNLVLCEVARRIVEKMDASPLPAGGGG